VAIGLVPDAQVTVQDQHQAFSTLTMVVGNEPRTLAISVAELVYVTANITQLEEQQ